MHSPDLYLLMACVGVFTALASIWDVRWMKMPNKLTVSGFVAGMLFHFVRGIFAHGTLAGGGYELFWWSICGFAVGFGVLFISFATGRGGGGDVKFMGAMGAWLGPQWTVAVLVGTAMFVVITGGVALALLAYKHGFNYVARRYLSPFQARKKNKAGPQAPTRLVAYAIPVTCAVWTLFGLVIFSEMIDVSIPLVRTRAPRQQPAVSADTSWPARPVVNG